MKHSPCLLLPHSAPVAAVSVNDTIAPANAASVVVVPEPSTWAVAVGGLGVMVLLRRRTRRTA